MTPDLPSEKICIVFYHGNDWDGVRARQRYLMQALSPSFRIIYLDGTPSRRGFVTVRRPEPGVTVVAGLVSLLTALERRSLGWLAHCIGFVFALLFRQCHEQFIFWNAENSACPFRYIPHSRLVFDCIDPSFSTDDAGVAAFHQRESEVLRRADVVFASAASLVDRCRAVHNRVHLLNNACEPEEYSEILIGGSPQPSWWPAGDRPIAAYLGSLDWRFDFAMMIAVAEQSPKLDFILAGNVIPECQALVERLRTLPNVICPGRISVADGRYLIAHCSVGLIPFRPGVMNDAVNPVKLYAYALLGKAIVGTPIRELCERPEVALIGRTPAEFANHLADVVDGSDTAPALGTLQAFARGNTWKERAVTVACAFRELGWVGSFEMPASSRRAGISHRALTPSSYNP